MGDSSINSVLFRFGPWLLFIAILGFFLFQSWLFPLHDFTNYYFGAKLFALGEFSRFSYFPCFFNDQIAALAYPDLFGNFNPNSPFLLLFYYPFTWLSPEQAKLTFNLLSAALFSFSFYRLCIQLKTPNWAIGMLSLVMIIPIKNNLLFGQTYLLLSSLLIEGYLAHEKGHKKMAAIWWSLAISLKLFPVFIFIYLLAKRDFKTSQYLLIAGLLLGGLTTALVGLDVVWFYIIRVFPLSASGLLSEELVVNYQSWGMWIKYIFIPHEFYNPDPLLAGGAMMVTISNAIFYGVIVMLSYAVCVKFEAKKAFGVLLLGMLMLTPYGNTYSLVLIGLSTVLFIDDEKRVQNILLLFLVGLICTFNYHWLEALSPVFQFPRLWLMLLFFVLAITFLGRLQFTPRIWALGVLFAILKLEYNPPVRENMAVNPTSIICDFERKGNEVYLSGMNRNGETNWTEPLLTTLGELELSDKNRGLGYFTLVNKKPKTNSHD